MLDNFNLNEFENLLIEGENKKKENQKIQRKEYYKNNKDKIKVLQKNYRKNNKEHNKAYQKEYRENNKDKIKDYKKEYRENNEDKIKSYQKEYRNNNKDKMSVYKKEYYKNNKNKMKEHYDCKSKELGFNNIAQRQRYNRWCNKNNIKVSIKNEEYLNKIQYWINNIDKKERYNE